MSSESDSTKDDWISEDAAHRVLARAVELDAQDRADVSIRQLHEAAREAGISRGAFEQALSELKAGTLGPPTIGQAISARLSGFRRAAGVLGFFGAAIITPGDAAILTAFSGLAFYGAYEGAIALARLLGQHTPRVPPASQKRIAPSEHQRAPDLDGPDSRARFTVVVRGRLHVTGPAR